MNPRIIKTCRNGLHDIEHASDWRAPNGSRCRECYHATQRRYDASPKGQARKARYAASVKRLATWAEYRVRQQLKQLRNEREEAWATSR